MNFVALGVIAEIDDIYAGTMNNNISKELIDNGKELVVDEEKIEK